MTKASFESPHTEALTLQFSITFFLLCATAQQQSITRQPKIIYGIPLNSMESSFICFFLGSSHLTLLPLILLAQSANTSTPIRQNQQCQTTDNDAHFVH